MAGTDLLAFDSLGSIATIGVFGPAAILVALVVYAVIRDRRRHPGSEDDGTGTERHLDAARADAEDDVNRPRRAG